MILLFKMWPKRGSAKRRLEWCRMCFRYPWTKSGPMRELKHVELYNRLQLHGWNRWNRDRNFLTRLPLSCRRTCPLQWKQKLEEEHILSFSATQNICIVTSVILLLFKDNTLCWETNSKFKFLCVWNHWIFNYVNLIFNIFTVKIFSYTNSFCLLFYCFH